MWQLSPAYYEHEWLKMSLSFAEEICWSTWMYSKGLRWSHWQYLEHTGHAAAAPGLLLLKRVSPQHWGEQKTELMHGCLGKRSSPFSSRCTWNHPGAASGRRCIAFLCEGNNAELPPVLCSCGRRFWALNPSPTSAFLRWRFSGCCEVPWPGGARRAARAAAQQLLADALQRINLQFWKAFKYFVFAGYVQALMRKGGWV